MKATVDLPDDLLIEAKKVAAELRRPLRSIIESALRAELDALARPAPAEARTIRWVTVSGGLPAMLDLSDRERLGDWMMRERVDR